MGAYPKINKSCFQQVLITVENVCENIDVYTNEVIPAHLVPLIRLLKQADTRLVKTSS
jgi:hypothetical protein